MVWKELNNNKIIAYLPISQNLPRKLDLHLQVKSPSSGMQMPSLRHGLWENEQGKPS